MNKSEKPQDVICVLKAHLFLDLEIADQWQPKNNRKTVKKINSLEPWPHVFFFYCSQILVPTNILKRFFLTFFTVYTRRISCSNCIVIFAH